MRVLPENEINEKLKGLHGWSFTPEGIRKHYKMEGFMSVIHLVNRVAELAEAADHHPDILIRYDELTFTLITHYLGGITQKDFDLAARIDSITT